MARYDKYDSEVSGFRAPLAANLTLVNQAIGPIGVGLDANGRVTVGAPGNSGWVGVLCKSMPAQAIAGSAVLGGVTSPGAMANDIVDVMTYGEIVDLTGFVAGTAYYIKDADGSLIAAPAGGAAPAGATKKVGYCVEANHLIVRFAA